MDKISKYLPWAVIAGLLIFIFINRWSDFSGGTTKTVETDSTTTISRDSSQVEWDWIWQDIPTPDTVLVEVEVPIPTDIERKDSTTIRTYNPTYQDSVIHARWTLRIAGKLLSQDFQYTPRLQRVRLKTITNWNTVNNTITRTVRYKETPKGYMTAGGLVGVWPSHAALGPEIGWTSPRGDNIEVGFDALNNGIMVSGNVRVSFRRLLGL